MAFRFYNGNMKLFIDITSKIVFVIVSIFIGIVAYEGRTIVRGMADHERRITHIEANRYTANDALQDMRIVNRSVVELRRWIEDRYPPTWLKQDVEELKLEVKQLRIQILQRQVVAPG